MKLSGTDVDQMEPWMLASAYRSYITANTVPTAKPPSDDEYRAAIARTVH
jgi:hypothetical protein